MSRALLAVVEPDGSTWFPSCPARKAAIYEAKASEKIKFGSDGECMDGADKNCGDSYLADRIGPIGHKI